MKRSSQHAALSQLSQPRRQFSQTRRRRRRRRAQNVVVVPKQRLVPQETKYVDGYRDNANIAPLSNTADDDWSGTEVPLTNNTATYGCLPIPRIGDEYSDRDGRRIFIKSIRIKANIIWGGDDDISAPDTTGLVRIIVVQDTQTNGAAMSAEDAIGTGQGSDGNKCTSGTGGAINLPSNPSGWGRFKILSDVVIEPPTRPAYGDSTSGDVLAMVRSYAVTVRPNCYVNFSAATGAIASVIDNSFHLLVATQTSTAMVSASWYARTAFVG